MDNQSPNYLKVIRASILAIFIALLLFVAIQLTGLYYEYSQPTQIPGSKGPIELYSNQTQDDLVHIFQQAIEGAKESITLIIYALTDPQIIQSLQSKSESGVQVYIVCDARASPGISYRLPRAVIIKRLGQGLTHQKIVIIDNRLIFLGSANLTTSSLNLHSNLILSIDNPNLAQALTKRAKSMDEEGGYSPLLHKETTALDQNLELWVLPDDSNAAKRMIDLFRTAKKTIKVAMFTWTREDFSKELIEAAKRGVKVEAVMDRYSGKGASAKTVRYLKQNGIDIRLSTGNKLMHHKFAYIDETILVNGSANWTKMAFEDNDDFFIVLYPLSIEQQDKMNRIWNALIKGSEPIEASQ